MANSLWITSIALLVDTLREALARKIFWGLFAVSTVMILFFLFLMKIDIVEGATATVSLFGGVVDHTTSLERLVRQVYGAVAAFLYGFGMFLAVFASAGLTPSLLEPGRIELLLSKPVGRVHLLFGRFAGNILVISTNTIYLVLGVWAIFGWKTGVWNQAFLWVILTTIFLFTVLLTVVMLVGVVFESAALATMVTVALMLMSPILAQTSLMERLLSSDWSRQLWKGLYYVLPKTYDLGRMTRALVLDGRVDSMMPVWSSAAFAIVALIATLVIFARRDY